MQQSLRRATFKTSAWFATKLANAGVNVVNAASSSASKVIFDTDMLPAANVTSSVAATRNAAASASARPASASETRYRSLLSEPTTVRSEYEQSRGEIRGFAISKPKSLQGAAGSEPALRACGAHLGRVSHVRGVCSAQALHVPENPDRNERENEKRSSGRQGTSALNCYPWHPPSACRFLFAANGAPARSATPPRSSDQTFIFENLPRPDRKSPALRGRKPLQPRCISNRGCNRTHSATPARRRRHPAEFVSMRPRR